MTLLSVVKPERRWWVPEVVQTSAMDCGPAALKSLLEGFGIHASYGRLREACQTSVDGTSIDVLESVAVQLGLDAEQVMLPSDWLWQTTAAALPALVVVKQPNGGTHFVVVWRRRGHWLQVMDPGVGRRWVTSADFTRDLFIHTMEVPAADWYAWASSPESVRVYIARLHALGIRSETATSLVERFKERRVWSAMASLDAAIRLLTKLVEAGTFKPGTRTGVLLENLLATGEDTTPIPKTYWSARPADPAEEPETVSYSGAVLLRVRGRLATSTDDAENPDSTSPASLTRVPKLTPELAAALNERPTRPFRELWQWLRKEEAVTPFTLFLVLGLTVAAVLIEALLFRAVFDLARDLPLVSQRLMAVLALVSFVVVLWALELPTLAESLRLGRHLEGRLRLQLLEKLPRLSDRYLQSRPLSDMADRSHSIYLLRQLPGLVIHLVSSAWELTLVLLGIGLIAPASLPAAVLLALVALTVPALAHSLVRESDLRVRSHAGALSRFYLDGLLGLVPIRAHCAERSVLREHESLLTEWTRSAQSLIRLQLSVKGIQATLGLAVAGWLLLTHVKTFGVTGDLLLLTYWVLKLPALGEGIVDRLLQLPMQENILLRLFEPLNAPEPITASTPKRTTRPNHRESATGLSVPSTSKRRGAAIELKQVEVVAAGHTLLREVDLRIHPGEHIAVVGPSGAGKSTLLGLLLGFHQPARGQVTIDRSLLTHDVLEALRPTTAWLDPAVQLWNRSLLDNLRYSAKAGPFGSLSRLLEQADLAGVLARLPDGLQSRLGEGGASLSGGEGQRVRLARALWQRGVRLALLDEPFRGLDRAQRQRHMATTRRRWSEATLLCVTHDIRETRDFDRVIVIDKGTLVEDGNPVQLEKQAGSHYRALLDAETSLRQALWNGPNWRRLRMNDGQAVESAPVVDDFKSLIAHE